MNPAHSADSKKVALPRVPDGLARKVLWCILALRRIAAAAGVNLQIVGASRASVGHDGQVQLKVEGGSTTAPSSEIAFTIRSNYSIVPGLIGTLMPTIGGVRLDHSTPPTLTGIPSSGVRYVYAQVTFTTTFVSGYLSAFSLSSVPIIASSSASPTNTTSLKHLLLGTITDGVPSNPYANQSPIPVTLWDSGFEETTLRVGNL